MFGVACWGPFLGARSTGPLNRLMLPPMSIAGRTPQRTKNTCGWLGSPFAWRRNCRRPLEDSYSFKRLARRLVGSRRPLAGRAAAVGGVEGEARRHCGSLGLRLVRFRLNSWLVFLEARCPAHRGLRKTGKPDRFQNGIPLF